MKTNLLALLRIKNFTTVFTKAVSEPTFFFDATLLAHANINLPKSHLLQPGPFLSIAGVSLALCSGP